MASQNNISDHTEQRLIGPTEYALCLAMVLVALAFFALVFFGVLHDKPQHAPSATSTTVTTIHQP